MTRKAGFAAVGREPALHDAAHKMPCLSLKPWLGVVLLALVPSIAAGQCRIEGTLVSIDDMPVPGATIRLQGPELRTALTATTDAAGRFAFDNITPGIRVEMIAVQGNGRLIARGFTLATLAVEKVTLKAQPDSSEPLSAGDVVVYRGAAAEVRGVVRSADGLAVAGARVVINDTMLATATDTGSRYALSRLRSGLALELTASADGFAPAHAQVIVPASGSVDEDFTLQAATVADASRSEAAPAIDVMAEGRSVEVRPADLAALPALGRSDVFRALQLIPGITAGTEDLSAMYVRGGTPDETRITYDGFAFYPVPHLLGALAPINMDAVDRATFTEGSVGADEGGRLAGALSLSGASGAGSRPTGSVDLSVLGTSAHVGVPIGDRASFLIAIRESPPSKVYDYVLDQVGGGGTAATRDRVPEYSGGSFAPAASSFRDVNGKIEANPSSKDRVSASLYDGRDTANLSRDVPTPQSTDLAVPSPLTFPADLTAQVTNITLWNGRGMSASWDRLWSSAVSSHVTAARSAFSTTNESASLLTSPTTGVDYSFAAGRGGSNAIAEANDITDTTVRLTTTINAGFAHLITVGGDVTSIDASYSAQSELYRHVGALFTSQLANLFDRNDSGRVMTAFAQDVWRPSGRLTISPGARLTRADLAAATYVDPRVSATYLLMPLVRLTAAWSIDHQPFNQITREDRVRGDGAFWALSDGRTIPITRSNQADGGAIFEVPGFIWRLDAYYKTLDDLTMLAPRAFPGVAPNPATRLQYGSGRAEGIEMFARYQMRFDTAWASYTLSRAQYTYPTLEASTFYAPFDQPQEFKIADTAQLFRVFSLGAVLVAASGRPTTPAESVDHVIFPNGDTQYTITFGPKNSERLPVYGRLDLSAQCEIRVRAVTTTIGGSVLNATDRQNIAYVTYEAVGNSATPADVNLLRRTYDVYLRFAF